MDDELGRTLEGPENHTMHNMVVRATIRKWLMCVECGIAKRATGRNQTHEVTDWDRKVLIPNYGGLFKTHD